MTNNLLRAAVALALASMCAASMPARAEAAAPAVSTAAKSASGLTVTTAQGTVRIEPWSERIVHVLAGPAAQWDGNYNPAVIARPGSVDWTLAETADYYQLATSALSVRVAKAGGAVSFHDAQGKQMLAEAGRDTSKAGVMQGFDYAGPVFGLGQHQNGKLDYRGTSVRLQQANRDVAVPIPAMPSCTRAGTSSAPSIPCSASTAPATRRRSGASPRPRRRSCAT